MTALLLHTGLSLVLIAWAFVVTAYIPYRPAWIWTGTALVVLVGYVSLLAKSVFEGAPVRVQVMVGNVGATLIVLAAVASLALFGAVSRGPRMSVAARGVEPVDAVDGAPRNEEPVIVPDRGEDVDSGSVIDAGSWSSAPRVVEPPRGGRYAYASAEAEAPRSSRPARDVGSLVEPPAASRAASPAETLYQPMASPPEAASARHRSSSADEDAPERIAPRRALSSPSDMEE